MNLNRSKYFDYIEGKLNELAYSINSRGKLNVLNYHNFSEGFYADLLTEVYGWELTNANESQQNIEAIDLIDHKEKLVVQVSSTNTVAKVESSLSKNLIKQYSSYSFKFVSIAKDAKNLRGKTFNNPHSINFDPSKDIIDIDSILKSFISAKIEHQRRIYDLIRKELDTFRLETEIVEVETIMSLIDFLSRDENLTDTEETPSEVDPEKKFHRFSEHSDFLENQFNEMLSIYGVIQTAKEKVGLDGVKAKKISIYLKNQSDLFLNENGNNPRLAIEKLTEFFEEKLTSNGLTCDNTAIRFYLLNELIECNVFPNPVNK